MNYYLFGSILFAFACLHIEEIDNCLQEIDIWLNTPYQSEPGEIIFAREPYTKLNFQSLRSLRITSSKLIGEIVERNLLLKRTFFGYWNKVSMNLRFVGICIASISITTILSIFGFIETNSNSSLTFLTTFAVILNTLFWPERTSYYEKWLYLAGLYNEVLKAKPYVLGLEAATDDIYSHRESLKIALAMDIVEMEMWSHRSFKSIFSDTLKSAIKSKLRKNISDEDFYYYTQGITKSMAISLLSEYQNNVLEDEKSSYKSRVYLKPA